MPKYQIEMNGQTFEVEAADENALKGALGKLQEMSAPKRADVGNQKVGASDVYTDEMLFGLPGKAASGVNALVQRGIAALPGESPWEGKSVADLYATNRGQYNNAREQYAAENPVANTLASIGGAIHGGASLSAGAGNVIANAAPRVASALQGTYLGRMAADAVSGAAQGAASAYGHDQDIGTGTLLGGVIGGVTRPVIDAGTAVARSIAGLVGAGNNSRANAALAEALMRSGKSADDVADDLARAAAEGQPEYMLVDSLGNPGQRMLSGISRSPGDSRKVIYDTLQNRQAGQGERLVNALSEGFDAPQTAAQTRDALTQARTSAANANYGAARSSAGTVDPTAAIQAADDFLGTAGSISRTGIADDSIEGAVRRAKSMLTDGQNVVSDYDTVFRSKLELDAMIERAQPTIQRQLIPIRNALDDALAASSQPYAAARDTFRQQSRVIDAVDQGAAMSSPRMRADDTTRQFQSMTPEQQAAARIGYADPLIARVEGASISPTTNKARMIMTEKTGQEFPVIAAPGRADVLGNRIAREQRMFETANAALGGSKTADNLSDIADVQSFDPTMLGAILSGNFKGAALQGLQRGINSLQGRNSQTRDLMARMLMEADPNVAREIFRKAADSGKKLTKAQEALGRALISGGATQPFRLLQGQ